MASKQQWKINYTFAIFTAAQDGVSCFVCTDCSSCLYAHNMLRLWVHYGYAQLVEWLLMYWNDYESLVWTGGGMCEI